MRPARRRARPPITQRTPPGSVWCLFWCSDGDAQRSLGSIHATKESAEAFLALDPEGYPHGYIQCWTVHSVTESDPKP